jgi:hypothetical protein
MDLRPLVTHLVVDIITAGCYSIDFNGSMLCLVSFSSLLLYM